MNSCIIDGITYNLVYLGNIIYMKKTLILILLLSLAHSACHLSGCVFTSARNPAEAEMTYRDVPGVTEQEISAIEKLKGENSKFIYG